MSLTEKGGVRVDGFGRLRGTRAFYDAIVGVLASYSPSVSPAPSASSSAR